MNVEIIVMAISRFGINNIVDEQKARRDELDYAAGYELRLCFTRTASMLYSEATGGHIPGAIEYVSSTEDAKPFPEMLKGTDNFQVWLYGAKSFITRQEKTRGSGYSFRVKIEEEVLEYVSAKAALGKMQGYFAKQARNQVLVELGSDLPEGYEWVLDEDGEQVMPPKSPTVRWHYIERDGTFDHIGTFNKPSGGTTSVAPKGYKELLLPTLALDFAKYGVFAEESLELWLPQEKPMSAEQKWEVERTSQAREHYKNATINAWRNERNTAATPDDAAKAAAGMANAFNVKDLNVL
jgi:hypothetical protein